MKESKLERGKIGLKEIFQEIRYVGLGHYLEDLTARVIDGRQMHYHKRNHTSKNSLVLHSLLYE